MFGVDDPERLFKTTWNNVNDFAQELYTMFKSSKPTKTGPVEINVPEGQTGLTIKQSAKVTPYPESGFSGKAQAAQAQEYQQIDFTPPAATPYDPLGKPKQLQDDPSKISKQFGYDGPPDADQNKFRPDDNPALKVEGNTYFTGGVVGFQRSPMIWNQQAGQWRPMQPPLDINLPTNWPKPTSFPGKVVGKTGEQTYDVILYRGGALQSADNQKTSVLCPNVDPGETIPNDTWLESCIDYGDGFQSFPPVWVT